jgi:methylase of polypeptide subunit release factors
VTTDSQITWAGRAVPAADALRQRFRNVVHFFSYHLLLKRSSATVTRAAGFRLTLRPTVFHPRYFRTIEYFASFVDGLDLRGKRVADVCTGSGIIALAAARAGASSVIAIDINPNAAGSAADNARLNGFAHKVTAIGSDLLAAIRPGPIFDVIFSNPPYFEGEPRDLADRAWSAGENYRDIAPLFEQVRERLAPGGRFYLLLSSESDLDLLGTMARRAGFHLRLVAERSIVIESFLVYELTAA